jgi:parallel beta-helix repeat protein
MSTKQAVEGLGVGAMLAIGIISGFGLPTPADAATYFVDFELGTDTNDGADRVRAWKHCPGDSNAGSVPAAILLQPGDSVRFKGGVAYGGAIKCSGRGSQESPIVYDGNLAGDWGTGPAVIDGTESVTGWARCTTEADVRGNTNWSFIHYADLQPAADINSVNILEDGVPLWAAQTPEPLDRFFWDNTQNYFEIPSSSITSTSLVDQVNLPAQPAGFWHGAYAAVWHQPNLVSLCQIQDYDATNALLRFSNMGTPYLDRSSRYAIVNSISHISGPGQFALMPQALGSRLFIWPRSPASPGDGKVRLSVRNFGFDINKQSHITIRGFRVIGQSGKGPRNGIGIGSASTGPYVTNITIQGNTVAYTRSDGKGYGGINLTSGVNCSIISNVVHEVQRHTGIFVTDSKNCRVTANTVSRPGYVGIWALGDSNLTISGNKVKGCLGTHANGISVYTQCRDVEISGNLIEESDLPLTLSTSDNLRVINNIVVGTSRSTKLLAVWAGVTGSLRILNNIFIGSINHSAVYTGSGTLAEIEMRNNIVDGGGGGTRSHNIYVGLDWSQSSRYGWSLAEGEMIITNLNAIFRAPQNGDFRLQEGSSAINAGTNLPEVISDCAGTARPQGTAWDIGAYEYLEVLPNRPPVPGRPRVDTNGFLHPHFN